MRIEWNRSLETGCRTIDLQHEELVGMINELHDTSPVHISQLWLDDILQRLDGYIAFHFGTEEQLMAKLPGQEEHAKAHVQQHRLFVEQVNKVKSEGGEDFGQMIRDIANFLSDWLYQHILKTDYELARLLNSQTEKHRLSGQ
jgi:hemerythrin